MPVNCVDNYLVDGWYLGVINACCELLINH